MRTIELNDYELNDLARTLKYAKGKKEAELRAEGATKEKIKFELGTINVLISRLPLKPEAYKAIFGDK